MPPVACFPEKRRPHEWAIRKPTYGQHFIHAMVQVERRPRCRIAQLES
jgi:hypothetical protein